MSARKRKHRQNVAQQASARRTWWSFGCTGLGLIYSRARRWYK